MRINCFIIFFFFKNKKKKEEDSNSNELSLHQCNEQLYIKICINETSTVSRTGVGNQSQRSASLLCTIILSNKCHVWSFKQLSLLVTKFDM